ncbi:hypothetical protein ACRARG_02455 [Pseudooceanicola sp. C21-150M6]|uniref:hypothetical protein n=1 Tax=Pseudooceanicola sp. C21-150M6 TaxID=3434355 RepID=UPI003D7FCD12
MNRFSVVPCLAAIILASAAQAKIEPEQTDIRRPILTPTIAETSSLALPADQIDACRETLSRVLGAPMLGSQADYGMQAAPTLPFSACVQEARN